MHNGLTVVAWQLKDVNEGDGGFCVVPGSHKGNYPCPDSMVLCERYRGCVKPVTSRAGDVVIFTEALTHGALPWTGKQERRAILFKIAPACIAYSPGYQKWPTDPKLADMTDAERGVIEAPYKGKRRSPPVGPVMRPQIQYLRNHTSI